MAKAYGKKVWLIPDGFLHSVSLNDQVSHEAVCVLNTSDKDATVTLTLYFEDRDVMTGFSAECKAGRTHHIRPVSYTHLDVYKRQIGGFHKGSMVWNYHSMRNDTRMFLRFLPDEKKRCV